MKTWKIHAGWAVVLVLVTGAWGRWCATRAPAQSQARESSAPLLDPNPERAGRPGERPALKEGMPRRASPPGAAPGESEVLPAYSFEILSLGEIRKLLKSESLPEVAQAAHAIERLTDQKLRRELLLELSTTPHSQLRYNCLLQLAAYRDADVIARLQQALASDSDLWIRRAAATELGKLGGEGTVELLLRNATDENLHFRVEVAAALNQLGHPGATADLIPRLTADLDNPDGSVREDAVESLSILKSPLALPALVRATRDRSGDVRFAAARGLAELGTPDVVPVLQAMLKDPVSDVVEEAKEGLESIERRTK